MATDERQFCIYVVSEEGAPSGMRPVTARSFPAKDQARPKHCATFVRALCPRSCGPVAMLFISAMALPLMWVVCVFFSCFASGVAPTNIA